MSSSCDTFNRRTFVQWSTGALAVASVPFLPAARLIDCNSTRLGVVEQVRAGL